MTVIVPVRAALGFAATVLVSSLTMEARAQDASPWLRDGHSAVRLLAGSRSGAVLLGGIAFQLQPGWKTYWRTPGDSGVPPRFDFAGSGNLKAAKVLYPAPHVFTDETGTSIGYTDDVIFPVRVIPRDPGKPVTLKLKIEYAVCEKLCIPAEGSAELKLAPGTSAQDADLVAAEARVPKEVSAAEAGLTVRRVNNAAKPLIAVDLKVPTGKPVALLVEGPTPEWALPVPKPAQGAPAGHRHFGFELDGLPPGVSPKGPFELTFTIIEGDSATEVKTQLD